MLNALRRVDRKIYDALVGEVRREQVDIELIASENYVSQAVLDVVGSVWTNKYAEGYPGRRYYGGCEFADVAEKLAIERAQELFKAEHVNVQPHSGSQANMAVYFSCLKPGDTILGMALDHGGHLSHGHPKNFTSSVFDIARYGVDKETELIDIAEVHRIAKERKPKLIIVGASSYPRKIDFEAFAQVARDTGALLMADIAHIAGPIASQLHPDPVPHCDFITATTHKTLRGPRGGLIMCKEKYAKSIDSSVFPGIQGGPLIHVVAGKAVSFEEALEPSFRKYQEQIIKNAAALGEVLQEQGLRLVTGGTDNHLLVVDLRSRNLTGIQATRILDRVGITVNNNQIPFDPLPPMKSSGIRIGTPAMTTRGLGEKEMRRLGHLIVSALDHADNEMRTRQIREQTLDLADRFPVYPGILRRLYEQDRGAYDF
ncbi:MAG: serine hydroxymethyltransferase [Deltaproteobacteria bacterium]|nr:serine hydroxymethyltransferase [Deltaproteobacteria bacterium]MBW1872850.1 serine hydroxymethyltransferase [Deltaproteobacteria bacterium]